MLVDGLQRRVEYLRLSLTERCNLACAYCVPQDEQRAPADWLTDDEVVGLCAALRPLGVRRVRLTGGEPTLRPRLAKLVERLAALHLDDLSLTTNATRLEALAAPLRAAGLARLNLSLDTLRPDWYAQLCGAPRLAEVLRGIEAAAAAGYSSLKLNVVALAGLNDDELPALARYAWDRNIVPRFIELMPMADGAVAPRARFLAAAEIRARLQAAFGPLVADDAHDLPGVGPARYFRIGAHHVGVIAAVTERFCAACNRIRVDARGRLHACLGVDDSAPLDLRAALRQGDDLLRAAVLRAVGLKAEGHTFTLGAGALAGGPRRSMIVIGG